VPAPRPLVPVVRLERCWSAEPPVCCWRMLVVRDAHGATVKEHVDGGFDAR
jgi:hypothetical protein